MAEYGRRYCLARASNGEYMEKDNRRDVELTQRRGAEEERKRETTYMKSACCRGSRKTGTAPGMAMPFFMRRLLTISPIVVFVAWIPEENAVIEGNRINALRRITGLNSI